MSRLVQFAVGPMVNGGVYGELDLTHLDSGDVAAQIDTRSRYHERLPLPGSRHRGQARGTITFHHLTDEAHTIALVTAGAVPKTTGQVDNCQVCNALNNVFGINGSGPPTGAQIDHGMVGDDDTRPDDDALDLGVIASAKAPLPPQSVFPILIEDFDTKGSGSFVGDATTVDTPSPVNGNGFPTQRTIVMSAKPRPVPLHRHTAPVDAGHHPSCRLTRIEPTASDGSDGVERLVSRPARRASRRGWPRARDRAAPDRRPATWRGGCGHRRARSVGRAPLGPAPAATAAATQSSRKPSVASVSASRMACISSAHPTTPSSVTDLCADTTSSMPGRWSSPAASPSSGHGTRPGRTRRRTGRR